jgi:hypothetical protein
MCAVGGRAGWHGPAWVTAAQMWPGRARSRRIEGRCLCDAADLAARVADRRRAAAHPLRQAPVPVRARPAPRERGRCACGQLCGPRRGRGTVRARRFAPRRLRRIVLSRAGCGMLSAMPAPARAASPGCNALCCRGAAVAAGGGRSLPQRLDLPCANAVAGQRHERRGARNRTCDLWL